MKIWICRFRVSIQQKFYDPSSTSRARGGKWKKEKKKRIATHVRCKFGAQPTQTLPAIGARSRQVCCAIDETYPIWCHSWGSIPTACGSISGTVWFSQQLGAHLTKEDRQSSLEYRWKSEMHHNWNISFVFRDKIGFVHLWSSLCWHGKPSWQFLFICSKHFLSPNVSSTHCQVDKKGRTGHRTGHRYKYSQERMTSASEKKAYY